MKRLFILFISLILIISLVGCKKDKIKYTLSTDEYQYIKETYYNYTLSSYYPWISKPDDVVVKYFLGNYNGKYVVIIEREGIKHGSLLHWEDSIKINYYFVGWKGSLYKFMYVPEKVGIVYDNKYYNIDDDNIKDILTSDELGEIYERLILIEDYYSTHIE